MSTKVLSLFDYSANMVIPWAMAGCACYVVDIKNEHGKVKYIENGSITWLSADLSQAKTVKFLTQFEPDIVFGFPPCTDLAVSGAKHFAAKAEKDVTVFKKAYELVQTVEAIGNYLSIPWMLENPVGLLSSIWRKPDFIFHPYEYGGYLPVDDIHPRFSKYIAPRDSYKKKTCIWCGNGFVQPKKIPVSVHSGWNMQTRLLGGKSEKTKQIRNETPRGFSNAVFVANYHIMGTL